MADDKRKAPGTAEGARRRQPPTIDLTAKDITGEVEKQATAQASEAPKAETPQAEAPKTERSKAEPPKAEQPADAASPLGRKPALVSLMLAAGGGGVIVAAAMAALMLSGALMPRSSGGSGSKDDALTARLDAIDRQVIGLASRPQVSASTGNDAAIAARLDKIEQALAKLPAAAPAGAEKLGAIDGNLKALGTAIAGINRRVDEIAANAVSAREESGATAKALNDLRQTISNAPQPAGRADLDAIGKRLDAVEAVAKTATQSNAQASSASAAVRLALAASALREAVNGGNAYTAELDAVKAAGGNSGAVAALAPFATKGLPSDAALAKDLLALVPAMSKASGVDKQASGGFLEKLQANAEKLVRVRPVDGPAGADAGAVIARIEAHAARNDVSAARAEVEQLPPAAKQAAAPWLKAVTARDAAREAVRRLASTSMRGLAGQ
ncbi:MAG: mitofilin family membrane protein [Xanthobacteraceae bacterium]|uniref:COG4223 family protein n=1 Tax=Pseudolabrys sp. TaxID=1960880 RepID=UPI003D0E67DE